MAIYRTLRPITVDARQCTAAETIATDLGFVNARQGEWVIRGEGGECYLVDDAFFQRTFIAVQEHARLLKFRKPTKSASIPTRRKPVDRSFSPIQFSPGSNAPDGSESPQAQPFTLRTMKSKSLTPTQAEVRNRFYDGAGTVFCHTYPPITRCRSYDPRI
jgi:hypothetical protein